MLLSGLDNALGRSRGEQAPVQLAAWYAVPQPFYRAGQMFTRKDYREGNPPYRFYSAGLQYPAKPVDGYTVYHGRGQTPYRYRHHGRVYGLQGLDAVEAGLEPAAIGRGAGLLVAGLVVAGLLLFGTRRRRRR